MAPVWILFKFLNLAIFFTNIVLILLRLLFGQALSGVYAKDIHVRMACLNAVKCIPAVSNCSIPQNVEVATSLWLALHDTEKVLWLVFSLLVTLYLLYSLSVFLQFLDYYELPFVLEALENYKNFGSKLTLS